MFFCFFFWVGFYGPFKNISLISSRLFIKDGRKPENTGKKHLTICKQNLAFPHVTQARLKPQQWETQWIKSQLSCPLGYGGPLDILRYFRRFCKHSPSLFHTSRFHPSKFGAVENTVLKKISIVLEEISLNIGADFQISAVVAASRISDWKKSWASFALPHFSFFANISSDEKRQASGTFPPCLCIYTYEVPLAVSSHLRDCSNSMSLWSLLSSSSSCVSFAHCSQSLILVSSETKSNIQ